MAKKNQARMIYGQNELKISTSHHSTVVQCWPGNVGVPSSSLGIDCFYGPTQTIQDEYPLTSYQCKQATIAQWFSSRLTF